MALLKNEAPVSRASLRIKKYSTSSEQMRKAFQLQQ